MSDNNAAAPWHALEIEQIFERLGSSADGLSAGEAAERLEKVGANSLEVVPPKTALTIWFDQFKDFMIGVLFAAAIISGLVGEAKDTIAIAVIILLNAAIGFAQEYRSEQAMAALRRLSAPSATVIRNGQSQVIEAKDLVPGDILLLETGMIVAADLRLFENVGLNINESSLTGESQPAQKNLAVVNDEYVPVADRHNLAFAGTIVTAGRGAGIVVHTGRDTQIGRIAGMVQVGEVKTPLQKRLARFGRTLALAVLGLSAILFIVGVLRGVEPTLMLLTAISIAVAAIPEALPAVVSISLALGAKQMVRRRALIRKLPAVETLGSVTFICSDKTGTLTQNKMKVEEVWVADRKLAVTGVGYGIDGDFLDEQRDRVDPDSFLALAFFLQAGALCNNAVRVERAGAEEEIVGDPTEGALLVAAAKAGVLPSALREERPRVAEIPFDSERKRMTTVHALPNGKFVSFTKGAFEALFPLMSSEWAEEGARPLSPERKQVLNDTGETLAADGLRVLAIAAKFHDNQPAADPAEVENDLIFVGLAGIMDPPRNEAVAAVGECRAAGIKPVMITGDHPATARAIADRLGIFETGSRIVTGGELERMPLPEFETLVEQVTVYARVSPEHKIKIVRALQDRGEIVAMTGDGVNDAPALKAADIGVAMGAGGTDVAKESSDMVLLDDNFATIVYAVAAGRRIYDNIRRFVRYTMTSNSGEIWVMFLAPFIGLPIPLLPIHILWINLVTDGLPGLALSAEAAEKTVMSRPPRKPKESIFAHGLSRHVVWVGLLMAGVTLFAQAWFFVRGGPWQTAAFTVLCLSQMGHVMAVRSETESLFRMGLFSNLFLVFAVLLTFFMQIAIIYLPALQSVFRTEPLSGAQLLLVLALSTVVFFGVELEKSVKRLSRP